MRIIQASVFAGVAGVMLVAIYGCAVQGSQGAAADDVPVATVSFCELMKDPKRYHDKIVRVNALWGRDFEESTLFDEDCSKGKPNYASKSATWVSLSSTLGS